MKYKTLTLLLTYNCNLACDYCFCGRKRKENMTEKTAKRAIDYFAENCVDYPTLIFFGGEPLLQADLIEKLCNYCDEKYEHRFSYGITTNGTLLTKENVELIQKHKIYVTLSLDGKKEIHDIHRHFYDGAPSFELIMNNIEQNKFDKNNAVIRLTFTKDSLKQLAENIIYLHKQGFKNLAFYPAVDSKDPLAEGDFNIFYEQIDLLTEYTYLCFQNNHPIKIAWIDKSIRSHIHRCSNKCMIGFSQFSVTPDEEIYPCNRIDFSSKSLCMGMLRSGIDIQRQIELGIEIQKKDPECQGCALEERCGICNVEAYGATGHLWERPLYYCLMNQYIIKKSDQLAERLYGEKNKYFMEMYYGCNTYKCDAKLLQ